MSSTREARPTWIPKSSMPSILAVSAIFVFANLAVDVLYTVIDPRIRYET